MLNAEVSQLISPLGELTAYSAEMENKLLAWCNINSGTNNHTGLKQLQRLLGREFTDLGLQVRFHQGDRCNKVDDAGNIASWASAGILVARYNPENRDRILLVGHLDTVYGRDHPFQRASCKGDRMHGPGCADMKGGLIVLRYALQCLLASEFAARVGVDVMLTSDEETGSHCSARLLAEYAAKARLALVFEPANSNGGLVGARPGSGNYTFTLHGRGGHAGRDFVNGRNALVAAARLVNEINQLNGVKSNTNFNIARFNAGSTMNSIPDFALVRVNLRSPESEDLAWGDSKLLALANQEFGQDITIKLHGGVHRPAQPLASKAELLQIIQQVGAHLGIELSVEPGGGCCDGNNISACGVPTVDTLGVCGGELHSEREYMLLASLQQRTRLVALLLLGIAAGAIVWPQAARQQ